MSASSQRTRGPVGGPDGAPPTTPPDDLPPLGAPADLPDPGAGSRGRPWIVAVVAGVVALALGLGLGVLAGFLLDDCGGEESTEAPATRNGDGSDSAADAPAGGSDVIPQRCLDAVELADDGLVLLDEAIDSVGDLDPGRLDTVLESTEELRPDLERAVRDCRSAL